MSPLMRSECRKFAPNIFNKTKCSNCFRQKEEHSAEALESNRATRKACKCGYLFVAPDWDFSNPINRTKRWQRRWFVLYDDGELTYSVDEHPETVPQAAISLIGTSGQGVGSIVWEAPESETGHPHSLAVAAPDRVHFVRGDTPEETKAWLAALLAVVSPVTPQGCSRLRQARHKRNATFPGGRSNPLSMGASQRAISGATSFSRQASPILRQRFNSCISPLHHAYPSEGDKESRMGIHSPSSVVSKSNAVSSASLPTGSSEVLVAECISDTAPTDCHLMPRIQVTGEGPSRPYFADSPSSKGNDGIEIHSRSSICPPNPNERVPNVNSIDSEVKISSSTRSFRSEVLGYGLETSKSSAPGSWRKHSSASEEKHTPIKSISPVEKTVRGDPDGCVLDSMSSSSCCSVETGERTDVITSADQISRQSNAKDEVDGKNVEAIEVHDTRELSHELSVKHGWLMKLGSSKEWSKHWFVLNGSGLLYYRDSSAEGKGILDGVIDLGLVSEVRETTVERNHGIQLMTWDGKQCLLSAVTPGIRTGWIAALRRAANLPPLPTKNLQPQLDQSRLSSEMSAVSTVGGSGLVSPQCSSEPHHKTSDNSLQGSSGLLNLISSPIHVMFSPTYNLGLKEKSASNYTSPMERTCEAGIMSPNNTEHKGNVRDAAANVSEVGEIKSSATSSPLVTENINRVRVTTISSDSSDVGSSLHGDNKSTSFSGTIATGSPKFSAEGREYEAQGAVNNLSGSLFSTVTSSADSSLSTIVPSSPPCLNVSCQVSSSRNNAHKPPVSPAVSSTSLRSARRHSSSHCVRQSGSGNADRGSNDHFSLERNLSDSPRPERPNFLPLKLLPNLESKGRGPAGYAPVSYISSSASSCSLSDEDFRTASEASLHSTPMSELIVDNNCNSIVWSKGELAVTKGEASSTYLPCDIGNDLGAILPPSPPLNRTPISRVKERARSRVVRRSKTPPEENLQSLKIESLSKKVKELVAALAAKEAELKLKEKSAEFIALTTKKSTMNGLSDSKTASSQSVGDGRCECINVIRQNSEEEIASLVVNTQGLTNSSKFGEYEEGVQSPVTISMRRLSSSAGMHALPRMGSLSDLTNVDLDLDVSTMDRERLIEEWCGLRARFEKAVREIYALRKELRACQGRVDALELESSATSMCLARERQRAEADMSLMVNRVQDLTVKLSAAEKQVRQLKQKTSRVESREKRRSLSLRGTRSGTDPSLGTAGRLPKEISDRLTRLEACLSAVQGSHHPEPVVVKSPGLSSGIENEAASKDKETRGSMHEQVPADRKIIVLPEVIDGRGEAGDESHPPSRSKEKEGSKTDVAANLGIALENGSTTLSGGALTPRSLDSKIPLSPPERGKSHMNPNEMGNNGGKAGLAVSSQAEVCTKAVSAQGSSTSEERRARAQGRRRLRLSSRLIRRGSEGDLDKQCGEPNSVAFEEEVEEVAGVEDDSSKGCDPLRILVRLSSLEGRVADYLKNTRDGKKEVPSEKTPVVKCPVSSNSRADEVITNELCPNCEKMNLTMERMKKELLLEKHAIGSPGDNKNSVQVQDGGPGMVERYREEIEQLRALCEKGMRAMDASHQRVIREMEEKHREEVLRVHREKEQALREETKATLAALDAMRKAHETEVQREVAKFKEEFTRRMSAKQELSSQHKAEMEGIRQEILSLSQRYSSKCLECASLREQLRIANSTMSGEMPIRGSIATFGEVGPGHS